MAYKGPVWEGVYCSFAEVPVVGPGFDGEMWIANSLKKIQMLKDEARRDDHLPPVSSNQDCLLPLLAALFYKLNGSVRILDFGGGMGIGYYQTVYGLPPAEGLEFHIVERESVCRAGKAFFGAAAGSPCFLSEVPDAPGMYDIVHLGSVIHYVSEWRHLISGLSALSAQYLLLTDVPAGNVPTFATAQHYYGSKIPVWFFNIEDILQAVISFGYELIFQSAYLPLILGELQELPMRNFERKYRLKRMRNLVFKKQDGDSIGEREHGQGRQSDTRC
jgi:putative methyltransferase (TIGR04325 family)